MISLLSKGLSRVFSSTTILSISSLVLSLLYGPTLIYLYMTIGKKHSFDIQTFVSKVKSLIFNVLSMLVIAFLPRGKHLLISWLQSLSTVILETKRIKSVTVSPSMPQSDGIGCYDLSFLNVLSQLFHTPLSPSSRGSLVLLHFLL